MAELVKILVRAKKVTFVVMERDEPADTANTDALAGTATHSGATGARAGGRIRVRVKPPDAVVKGGADVVLDRSMGQPLGMTLGSAPGAGQPMVVATVDPTGQVGDV
jgi:hypothetical protein